MKSSANFQIADGFVLGDWEVSPSSGELRSGDRLVRISPKVMDVLVHLATHADRVVSRDELISAVWVDLAVTDDSLTQSVLRLRRALGDSSNESRYIETVPKRGYRLLVPVSCLRESKDQIIAPADTMQQSIADRSPRFESRLGYSLVALILLAGGAVGALALNLGGKQDTSIGRQEEVAKSAPQFEAEHQKPAVAESVSAIQVPPAPTVNHLVSKGTDNEAAYDSFLFGLSHISKTFGDSGLDPFQLAHDAFDRSIELDPKFADPYAGLAWVEYVKNKNSCDAMSADAWRNIETSLDLRDNTLARRLVARRHLVLDATRSFPTKPPDHRAAISELRRSIELEPDNADALFDLGHALAYFGSLEEAVSYVERAKVMNPDYTFRYRIPVGIVAYLDGDFEKAVEEFKDAYDHDAPQLAGYWYVASLAKSGDLDAAKHAWGVVLGRWDPTGRPYPGVSTFGSGRPWTIYSIKRAMPLKQSSHMEAFLDGLRAMGVPEMPEPAA